MVSAPPRALRITELLDATPLHDPSSMRAIQSDVLCPPARTLLGLLRPLRLEGAAEAARLRLCRWDAHMDSDRTEPSLYEAVMRRFCEHALRPLCGEHHRILAGTGQTHPVFEYPGNITGRLFPNLLQRWAAGDATMLDGQITWTGVAARALAEGAADLCAAARTDRGRRWGQLHALTIAHPLTRGVAVLAPLLNAGRMELGGNPDTVMATSYNPAHPYRTALWAPSWRQVLDVGDWDASTGVQLGGQSGQPASSHYRDLVPRWHANRQPRMAWTEAAVASVAVEHMTLAAPGGR